jgi:hypothetical protein
MTSSVQRDAGPPPCWHFQGAAALALMWHIAFGAAPSFAFTSSPSAEQATAAAAQGMQQANSASHGYIVKPYVLYEVPDPLTLTPGAGEVEAVILGTPVERITYSGYLATLQGEKMPEARVRSLARSLSGTVSFIVFAHAPSAGPSDKSFLERFTDVALSIDIPEAVSFAPVEQTIFGPAKDFYNVPPRNREQRWLGTVTWRFSLQPLIDRGIDVARATGTLSFTDGTGKQYTVPFDLSRYD